MHLHWQQGFQSEFPGRSLLTSEMLYFYWWERWTSNCLSWWCQYIYYMYLLNCLATLSSIYPVRSQFHFMLHSFLSSFNSIQWLSSLFTSMCWGCAIRTTVDAIKLTIRPWFTLCKRFIMPIDVKWHVISRHWLHKALISPHTELCTFSGSANLSCNHFSTIAFPWFHYEEYNNEVFFCYFF